jgi:hypothetical protein
MGGKIGKLAHAGFLFLYFCEPLLLYGEAAGVMQRLGKNSLILLSLSILESVLGNFSLIFNGLFLKTS